MKGKCMSSFRFVLFSVVAVGLSACQADPRGEVSTGGAAPIATTMRCAPYGGQTPAVVDGARTVDAPTVSGLMANSRRPVLIDVAGGDERQSLPGAVWLPGAGVCDRDNPSIQARFEARIAELTGNDKSRPVVVFCHHQNCWLSYNAAIRLVRAGYTDVAWFRDGSDGYVRAGGRLERAARGW